MWQTFLVHFYLFCENWNLILCLSFDVDNMAVSSLLIVNYRFHVQFLILSIHNFTNNILSFWLIKIDWQMKTVLYFLTVIFINSQPHLTYVTLCFYNFDPKVTRSLVMQLGP